MRYLKSFDSHSSKIKENSTSYLAFNCPPLQFDKIEESCTIENYSTEDEKKAFRNGWMAAIWSLNKPSIHP